MKIVLAAGGSGGHVFPALSTAIRLREDGHQIVFLTTPGIAAEKIKKENFEFFVLCAQGLTLNSPKSFLAAAFCMVKAFGQAFCFLRKIQPDVVAGFGGYISFPAVVAAFILRRPALIHEQNVVPGKANLVLSKIADKVAVSFEKSKKYFSAKKVVLTGCPCREHKTSLNREEILRRFNLQSGRLTILVTGGSQGSQRLNEVFLETIPLFKKELNFQVIHISGKKDYGRLKAQYESLGVQFCLFDFLDEIDLAYTVADLVICRSGAMTVNEVAWFALPAIFVPYPFAGGHQRENAKVLCEAHTASLIEQKDLSAEGLKEKIISMLARKLDKKEITVRVKNIFYFDAPLRLAREIVWLKQ